MNNPGDMYGVLAEFDSADALIDAARATHDAGYTSVETMTPFPVEELNDALELPRSPVPLFMLIGGLCGGATAYFTLWYTAVIDYPWNVAGRPLHSWPSFIPITFELTVLGGVLFGLIAFFVLSRLTTLHHPSFNVRRVRRASRNAFFLIIRGDDAQFDPDRTAEWLDGLDPARVEVVPR